MRLSAVPLHQAVGQADLLRLARDALRLASARSSCRSTPQPLVEHFALLSHTTECLDGVLEVIRAELWQRAREGCLTVAEGPFMGEPYEALTTVDLWAARASVGASITRRAVDNAHIAASGLAETR